MAGHGPTPAGLARARALLEGRGFATASFRDSFLRRRVGARMIRTHLAETAYLALLAQDENESSTLAQSLSIAVSVFFRNPELFKALGPWLGERLSARDPSAFRALSAGCSTGEEAYSLALLAEQVASGRARPMNVLGLDRDRRALSRALAGIYPAARLQHVPEEVLRTRFEEVEPGFWRIKGPVRERVAFREQDLCELESPGAYDLVLLRNVLIYINREGQHGILARVAKALKPGGRLVLARIERIQEPGKFGLEVVDPLERIYRRVD